MARKNLIRAVCSRLSASLWAQGLLERSMLFTQDLMGIGTGGGPDRSGEKVLSDLLRGPGRTAGPLVVFDVGSNQGQFLAAVLAPLAAAGVSLDVHAFEPARAAFEILHERFRDRPNYHLNNWGLGDHDGESELFSNAPGSGLASLSRRRLDHFGIAFDHSERVQIHTLDGYCRERGIERIDLLKLDLEGHELDVLRGGIRMFRERRVRRVSFEFGGCNLDSRTYFQDFWYFFRERGPAHIHRITPTGVLVPIAEYREDLEQFRTTNFLAILPSE